MMNSNQSDPSAGHIEAAQRRIDEIEIDLYRLSSRANDIGDKYIELIQERGELTTVIARAKKALRQ